MTGSLQNDYFRAAGEIRGQSSGRVFMVVSQTGWETEGPPHRRRRHDTTVRWDPYKLRQKHQKGVFHHKESGWNTRFANLKRIFPCLTYMNHLDMYEHISAIPVICASGQLLAVVYLVPESVAETDDDILKGPNGQRLSYAYIIRTKSGFDKQFIALPCNNRHLGLWTSVPWAPLPICWSIALLRETGRMPSAKTWQMRSVLQFQTCCYSQITLKPIPGALQYWNSSKGIRSSCSPRSRIARTSYKLRMCITSNSLMFATLQCYRLLEMYAITSHLDLEEVQRGDGDRHGDS